MFWNQLADSISVLCGLAQVKLRTKEWRNSFGRAPVNTSRKRLVNKQSISVDWAFNFERKKKKRFRQCRICINSLLVFHHCIRRDQIKNETSQRSILICNNS